MPSRATEALEPDASHGCGYEMIFLFQKRGIQARISRFWNPSQYQPASCILASLLILPGPGRNRDCRDSNSDWDAPSSFPDAGPPVRMSVPRWAGPCKVRDTQSHPMASVVPPSSSGQRGQLWGPHLKGGGGPSACGGWIDRAFRRTRATRILRLLVCSTRYSVQLWGWLAEW